MPTHAQWLSTLAGRVPTPVSRGQHLLHNRLFRPAHNSPVRRLDETIAAFLDHYANPVTSRTYNIALRPFAETLGPHYPLHLVTPEMIDAWYQHICHSGLSDATLASRVKQIKVFWNWCVQRNYLTHSPARFLVATHPHPQMVSKAIPNEVLATMFDAVQHKPCAFLAARDTAILALLITFGARVGDVARLTLDDIHLENRTILFHTKGKRALVLPLPPQTGHHLATWLAYRSTCMPDPPHRAVFVTIHTRPGHRHAPLTSGSIATMIRRLSLQVGSQGYGPHSIRHWRGQTLADYRVPPTIVQTILGHSTVRITLEHYYNQDWSRVRQVLDAYEMAQSPSHDDPLGTW